MAFLAYYYFKKKDLANGQDLNKLDLEDQSRYEIILQTLAVYLFITKAAKI